MKFNVRLTVGFAKVTEAVERAEPQSQTLKLGGGIPSGKLPASGPCEPAMPGIAPAYTREQRTEEPMALFSTCNSISLQSCSRKV